MRHLPSAADLPLKAEDLEHNPCAEPTFLHLPAAEVQSQTKVKNNK